MKKIENYKKTTFLILLAVLLIFAVLALFFLSHPKKEIKDDDPIKETSVDTIRDDSFVASAESDLEKATHEVLLQNFADSFPGECCAEGHITFGTDKKDGKINAYLLVQIVSYGFENGYFTDVGGCMVPTVLVFHEEGGLYVLDEYIEAQDGEGYPSSIKEMFPLKYQSRVLGELSEAECRYLNDQNENQARAYLESLGRNEEIRSWRDISHPMFSDVGITVEVDEKINDAMRYIEHYQLFYGFEERLENGRRYIYRSVYDEKTNSVIYTKEDYESGGTLYRYAFDGSTGDAILPVNIRFSDDVNTEQLNVRDMQILASYIVEKLNGEPFNADEHWLAVINRAENIPLGIAGQFDGMEVYETDYAAYKLPVNKISGVPINDSPADEKQYFEYVFIYYTTDGNRCSFAGAMTYGEMMEKYNEHGKSDDREALLRSAALELMKNFPPTPDQLSILYPDYFNLETDKGLEVYVWKMSAEHYCFALLADTNREKTIEQKMDLEGISAEEMRVILQCYDIDPNNVRVIPFQHPLSSYYWVDNCSEFTDDDTMESLREMLGLR